jgi:hypothetical protein
VQHHGRGEVCAGKSKGQQAAASEGLYKLASRPSSTERCGSAQIICTSTGADYTAAALRQCLLELRVAAIDIPGKVRTALLSTMAVA